MDFSDLVLKDNYLQDDVRAGGGLTSRENH